MNDFHLYLGPQSSNIFREIQNSAINLHIVETGLNSNSIAPVLDPSELDALGQQGRTVIGYVNLAVTDHNRTYWNPEPNAPWIIDPPDENDPDFGTITEDAPPWLTGAFGLARGPETNGDGIFGYIVDYRIREWIDIVKAQAAEIISAGYDGLFLDDIGRYFTVGTTPEAALSLPEAAQAMMALATEVIQHVRAINPEAYIVINGGAYLRFDADPVSGLSPEWLAFRPLVDGLLMENQFLHPVNEGQAWLDAATNYDSALGFSNIDFLAVENTSLWSSGDAARFSDFAANNGLLTFLDSNSNYDAPPPPNGQPIAGDDGFTAQRDQVLLLNQNELISNDSDPENGQLSIVNVGAASNGVVSLRQDGTITFVPFLGFTGTASFDYTVADGFGGEATAIVSIEFEGPVLGNPPQLLNGSFEVDFEGWTLGGGQVNWVHSPGAGNARTSAGDTSLALGAWSTDVGQYVEQRVDTVIGQVYRLTFDAASAGTYGEMQVTITDPTTGVIMDQMVWDEARDQGLEAYDFAFTATGTQADVRFTLTRADGGGDFDVDNVRIEASSDLFINGSFENDFTGWRLGGGQPEWFFNPGAGNPRTSDGDASLALGAYRPGAGYWAEQTMVTEAGQTYRLEFDAAVAGTYGELRVVVLDSDGTTLLNQLVTDYGRDTGLEAYSFAFAGQSDAATVRFTLETADLGEDFDIDNVRLTPTSDLLVNGSFEDRLVGWTIGGGQPEWIFAPGAGNPRVSDGDAVMALGAGSADVGQWVEQSAVTTDGAGYRLSFDAAVAGSYGEMRVEVRDSNGGLLLDQLITDDATDQGLEAYSFNFTAQGTVADIRFTLEAAPGGGDFDLDNVQLNLAQDAFEFV